MRKIFFFLFSMVASVSTAEISVTPENVKAYVLRQNTWEKCVYPEYWFASPEQQTEMMEKSSLSDDPEERWLFYSHYKGSMRLTEEFFPDLDQEILWTTTYGFNPIDTVISTLSKAERTATLDCNSDWGNIAKPIFK